MWRCCDWFTGTRESLFSWKRRLFMSTCCAFTNLQFLMEFPESHRKLMFNSSLTQSGNNVPVVSPSHCLFRCEPPSARFGLLVTSSPISTIVHFLWFVGREGRGVAGVCIDFKSPRSTWRHLESRGHSTFESDEQTKDE